MPGACDLSPPAYPLRKLRGPSEAVVRMRRWFCVYYRQGVYRVIVHSYKRWLCILYGRNDRMTQPTSDRVPPRRGRLIVRFTTILALVAAGAVLCLSGISNYLRLPPLPETRFKLNKGPVYRGWCGRVDFGDDREGFFCDWYLLTDSYFETIGEPARVASWCDAQGLETLTGAWNVEWRYLRFIYYHTVPAWWDGCPDQVVIETGLRFQLTLH